MRSLHGNVVAENTWRKRSLKHRHFEPKVPIQEKQVPRHEGLAIGSEEDTLQNCLALNPKPPKKDYRKAFEKGGCVLNLKRGIFETATMLVVTITPACRLLLRHQLSSQVVATEPPMPPRTIFSVNLCSRSSSRTTRRRSLNLLPRAAETVGNSSKEPFTIVRRKSYTIKDMFVGNVLKLHKGASS